MHIVLLVIIPPPINVAASFGGMKAQIQSTIGMDERNQEIEGRV